MSRLHFPDEGGGGASFTKTFDKPGCNTISIHHGSLIVSLRTETWGRENLKPGRDENGVDRFEFHSEQRFEATQLKRLYL